MSHTNSVQQSQQIRMIQTTIVNYTQGGEAYTAAEFAVNGVVGVLLGQVPASANSLGVPLFPILDGGKVKLFQFSGGSPAEIPTTNTLNAVITALIWSD
jgi:hypothetical protein